MKAILIPLILVASLGDLLPAVAQEPHPLPELARTVLDEAKVFDEAMISALTQVVTEHELATGGRIVIAVLAQTGKEATEDLARRAFSSWELNRSVTGSNALMLISWNQRELAVRPGVGVDPLIVSNGGLEPIVDTAIDALRSGNAFQAVGSALHTLLNALESPVAAAGRDIELLTQAGFNPEWTQEKTADTTSTWQWLGLLLLGLSLSSVAMYFLVAGEAHYSAEGWVRIKPWEWIRWHGKPGSSRFEGGGTFADW